MTADQSAVLLIDESDDIVHGGGSYVVACAVALTRDATSRHGAWLRWATIEAGLEWFEESGGSSQIVASDQNAHEPRLPQSSLSRCRRLLRGPTSAPPYRGGIPIVVRSRPFGNRMSWNWAWRNTATTVRRGSPGALS